MRSFVRQNAVGPDDHAEDVVEPKRRENLQAIVVREPHADGMRGGRIARDGLVRGGDRRIGDPETTLEPQVHARLIADFYRCGEAR